MKGNYGEVLRLRNEYLNKARTDYNAQEQKEGKKLCSHSQIEQFKDRKKKRATQLVTDRKQFAHNEYIEYLQNRGGVNG